MLTAYTILSSINKSDSLSGKTQWTPSTWPCNLTTSSAGEDPVIYSSVTDVSLHWSAFSSLSKSVLEKHMQQNKKISGLVKNGEGIC